jgi:hypothetical protein
MYVESVVHAVFLAPGVRLKNGNLQIYYLWPDL